MDPIKDILHDQRSELISQVKQPPGKLTAEDIARLSAKREEIIMVLRLWHGYGRIAADRAFSNWLYDHAQGYSDRARSVLNRTAAARRFTPRA